MNKKTVKAPNVQIGIGQLGESDNKKAILEIIFFDGFKEFSKGQKEQMNLDDDAKELIVTDDNNIFFDNIKDLDSFMFSLNSAYDAIKKDIESKKGETSYAFRFANNNDLD